MTEIIKISRLEQLGKTHHEMFHMIEVYLEDCLRIAKTKRIDPHFTFTIDKIKQIYTLIQETKEKQ